MPDRTKTCARCQSRMEPGTVVVRDTNGGWCAGQWMQGDAEKSFWSGIKTSGREMLPLTAWRCTRCGIIEHYAEK